MMDHYHTFFVQSTVGMGCIDLSGHVLEVNSAFCKLLGYSNTELTGICLHYLVHPADTETFQDVLQRLLTDQLAEISIEHRFLRRSGESHWVISRFSILRHEETGNKLCIAGTFEDINQRKNLEVDLRNRAARDSLLAQFTQQMLQSLDLQEILQSSVDIVRYLLKTDRVTIYQFDESLPLLKEHFSASEVVGKIIIESVDSSCRPMLDHRIDDPCLQNCLHPFRKGYIRAAMNIHQAGYKECYVRFLTEFQVIANLVVPILQESVLWGLLVIQHCRAERDWQLDEINLVQQIAVQMAIAIKQIELHAQLRQEALHQQAINELSQAILGIQELEDFFELALDKIANVLQVEHVTIGQYQSNCDRWLIIAEKKKNDQLQSLLGKEMNFSPNALWEKTNIPSSILTITPDSHFFPTAIPATQHQSGNWLFSPLVINSGFWGSLIVYQYRNESERWETAKLDLLKLMSQQLSLAIQQNLFYRQWQRQLDQQAGLYRLVNAIRESLELPEIFSRAAIEVKGILQVERVLIIEFDPNERSWKVRVDEFTSRDIKSFVGLEIPDESNPLCNQLKQGEILRFNQNEQFEAEVVQILAKTFSGAWLMVPLRVSQMTWGMLYCIQKDPWQDWQESVAIAVADKLAIAIQQSILFQQVTAANNKLKQLAILDSLTQIPNRRYFDEHLQQEWKRAQRDTSSLSLILCDVDFFKLYNDTYGHHQGDETLRAIAKLLQKTVQRPGDIVARYGGEEFGVILPSTTSVGAARIAEAVQEALQRLSIPHQTSEVSEFITLSMGIASIYPNRNLRPTYLLNLADQALYQAKNQGRNRFCIYSSFY